MTKKKPPKYSNCTSCGEDLPENSRAQKKLCEACVPVVHKRQQSDRYFRIKGLKPVFKKVCLCGEKFETTWLSKIHCGELCRIRLKIIRRKIARQNPGVAAKRAWKKPCLQCSSPVTSRSHRVQHCSEECLYAWQVPRLGREIADQRASQRAMAKRQREHEKRQDEALLVNVEIPPIQLQHLSPEQIERYWDRIV